MEEYFKCNYCGREFKSNKFFKCTDCDVEICNDCQVVHNELKYCSKCYYDNHWKYRPNKNKVNK